MSALEETLFALILDDGLPEPLRNYKWAAEIGRKWDSDFVWVPEWLIVECEGGIWMQTQTGYSKGHAHPLRFIEDCHKYNAAVLLGWRVLRFTPCMVASGSAVKTIRKALDCAA